jgi:hypothetical protein
MSAALQIAVRADRPAKARIPLRHIQRRYDLACGRRTGIDGIDRKGEMPMVEDIEP